MASSSKSQSINKRQVAGVEHVGLKEVVRGGAALADAVVVGVVVAAAQEAPKEVEGVVPAVSSRSRRETHYKLKLMQSGTCIKHTGKC